MRWCYINNFVALITFTFQPIDNFAFELPHWFHREDFCIVKDEQKSNKILFLLGTFDSQQSDARFFNGTRQSKNLFDWIGIGIGRNVDPYLAKINKACLNGELAECFKSEALTSFSEFFDQTAYALNENVKVVQMSRQVVADVNRQPYEYSTEPR